MKVTRGKIFQRGLTHRCPNCGEATLFKPGTFFELNPACSHCGFRFDTDEGSFLGAFALNYGVSTFAVVVPVILVSYHFGFPIPLIAVLALSASVGVPALLYRASRSWWLMCDVLFEPQKLPVNQESEPISADYPTA